MFDFLSCQGQALPNGTGTGTETGQPPGLRCVAGKPQHRGMLQNQLLAQKSLPEGKYRRATCLPRVTGDLVWPPAAPSPVQGGIWAALKAGFATVTRLCAAAAISAANLGLTLTSGRAENTRAAVLKAILQGWRAGSVPGLLGGDAAVSGGVPSTTAARGRNRPSRGRARAACRRPSPLQTHLLTRFLLDSGRSKAVSMRMAVSPRCRSDAGPEAGGRAPKSPGAGQGQREHLIRHRSTLHLRAAPSNVLLALKRLNSASRNYWRLRSVIPKFPSPCSHMIFFFCLGGQVAKPRTDGKKAPEETIWLMGGRKQRDKVKNSPCTKPTGTHDALHPLLSRQGPAKIIKALSPFPSHEERLARRVFPATLTRQEGTGVPACQQL